MNHYAERRQVVLTSLIKHGWRIVDHSDQTVRLRLRHETDRELRVAPGGAMTFAEEKPNGRWKTRPCRLSTPAWETGIHEALMAVHKWVEDKAEERRLTEFNRTVEREIRKSPKTLADDLPRSY